MNFFKNHMPFDVRCVAKVVVGTSSLLWDCVCAVMHSLKKMMIVLILIPVGCSFHSSAVGECQSVMGDESSSGTTRNETYWWDMEHEGKPIDFSLLPGDGKTVLTDASRWMIVLQNSEITIIRDFQKIKQITLGSVEELAGADEMGGDSDVLGVS